MPHTQYLNLSGQYLQHKSRGDHWCDICKDPARWECLTKVSGFIRAMVENKKPEMDPNYGVCKNILTTRDASFKFLDLSKRWSKTQNSKWIVVML